MTRSSSYSGAQPPAGRGASGETPRRLLAAAGPIFAQCGFDGVTLREVCREADTNVASVAYYFGDKMGLYRAVIRQIRESREHQYPAPVETDEDPRRVLHRLVHTILSRMLVCDASGWESQLMMREMQRPTPVFTELVEEYFRPLFKRLCQTLRQLVVGDPPQHVIEQLALSVVGQCLYYHVGSGVVQVLISDDQRRRHYDVASLSQHITAVTLSAAADSAALGRTADATFNALSRNSDRRTGDRASSSGAPFLRATRDDPHV